MFSKIMIAVVLILSAGCCFAINVQIQCPSVMQLHFQLQEPNQHWNKYQVSAQANIVRHNYPDITLSGTSADNKPGVQYAASYAQDVGGCLICLYTNNHSGFVVVSPDLSNHFRDCHFQFGDADECTGNQKHCTLICST